MHDRVDDAVVDAVTDDEGIPVLIDDGGDGEDRLVRRNAVKGDLLRRDPFGTDIGLEILGVGRVQRFENVLDVPLESKAGSCSREPPRAYPARRTRRSRRIRCRTTPPPGR